MGQSIVSNLVFHRFTTEPGRKGRLQASRWNGLTNATDDEFVQLLRPS
jgi:hypothetical protein